MGTTNIAQSSSTSSIRLQEQASTPSTPPTGFANLFVDQTPSLKLVNDAGAVASMGSVNMWTGNTNTLVVLSASTNDIYTGLTLSISPASGKVMLLVFYTTSSGWDNSLQLRQQIGYKVNTGSIVYISQNATTSATSVNNGTMLIVEVGLTAGVLNTIAMYAKNKYTTSANLQFIRVLAIEMAN